MKSCRSLSDGMMCLSHQDQFVSTQLSTPVCNGSVLIHQRLFAVHFILCLPRGQTLQTEMSLLVYVNMITSIYASCDLLTAAKTGWFVQKSVSDVMGLFMNDSLLLLGRDKCKDSVGELIICVSHHLYLLY